jgi:CRISPR-associated protein Csm4
MSIYKIKLQLRSSIRTPFHADTIFGHLCWAMLYIEGEDKLKEWLESYKTYPTLISNGFILGKFPRPNLPSLSLETLGNLKGFDPNNLNLITATILKRMKKVASLDEKWVNEHQASFSNEVLSSHLYDVAATAIAEKKNREAKTVQSVAITHNTYDRLNGRVLEGSLYEWEESFYLKPDGKPQSFWFLLNTETLSKVQIENMLGFIALSGFGADKSIGKGQIEISKIEEHSLPPFPNSNAFISLSNFIPAKPEDLNGYYKPITKFGKLGGEWAAGRVPFKKPVVMLQAGAVIKDSNYSETKFYGKLQKQIHLQEEIVQYGYAFPFPICLKEEGK